MTLKCSALLFCLGCTGCNAYQTHAVFRSSDTSRATFPIPTSPRPSFSVQRGKVSSLTHLNAAPSRKEEGSSWRRTLVAAFSQSVNVGQAVQRLPKLPSERRWVQILTLLRVCLPSVLTGVVAVFAFPSVALYIASFVQDAGAFSVLSQDASQFVQNFLTVAGLLFSILVGQTYYFLYTQQESIYYALFEEVTEAKSLLEQVALMCQGRSMYFRCLDAISRYVADDLKQLQADPAVLLSARPVDDPLESIMYMTSVGVPSSVYDTVKSLRDARAKRLGALQRKLPRIHMALLWCLAAVLIASFPLLGAGTQTIGGYKVLTVEGILFGGMSAGIVLTMRIVGELWRPAGGAYNVDAVLSTMVSGLEEELAARMKGKEVYKASGMSPSGPNDVPRRENATKEDILEQGPNVGDILEQGPNVGFLVSCIVKTARLGWHKVRRHQ